MERDVTLPLVRQFMHAQVLALPAAMPLGEAIERLRGGRYSGAPVMEDGRLVGMFTEWDAMRVLARAAWHELMEGTVGDHMSKEMVAVGPDDDLFAVVGLFERTRLKRVPVLDAGALVGIVSRSDVEDALWGVHEERQKGRSTSLHPPGAAWDPRRSAERDRS